MGLGGGLARHRGDSLDVKISCILKISNHRVPLGHRLDELAAHGVAHLGLLGGGWIRELHRDVTVTLRLLYERLLASQCQLLLGEDEAVDLFERGVDFIYFVFHVGIKLSLVHFSLYWILDANVHDL